MHITEWNQEEALAVRYEEGREVGFMVGIMESMQETPLNIARALLLMGFSVDLVYKETNVAMETLLQITENEWWLPGRRNKEVLDLFPSHTKEVVGTLLEQFHQGLSIDEIINVRKREREEEREKLLELLDQGLSIDEIKRRLENS